MPPSWRDPLVVEPVPRRAGRLQVGWPRWGWVRDVELEGRPRRWAAELAARHRVAGRPRLGACPVAQRQAV